jgi:chemotaxis protein MotB
MKGMEPEKPVNHERWVISYADFTTLLLATFVVMYAVSTVNSSKFQEMSESFSTAFMGRTTNLNDTGFGAANKGPFHFMPNPVEVPIVTREVMIRNAPPALTEEETQGIPNETQHGQFLPRGGGELELQFDAQSQVQSESQVQSHSQTPGQLQDQSQQRSGAPDAVSQSVRDQVAQRIQNLEAAFNQLTKSLAVMIRKGEINVSLRPLGVIIDINEVLLFRSGKADLTPDALPLIDEIAKILADLHYQIQVNGFTDNVPIHNAQFDSNWDLSASRAIAVVKRFVAAGIDPNLMVGAGFGEYHPAAPNTTVEGKAANRRVSIVVVSPLESTDPARSRLVGSNAEKPASATSPAATTVPPNVPPAAPSATPQATAPSAAPQAVPPSPATPTTGPAAASPAMSASPLSVPQAASPVVTMTPSPSVPAAAATVPSTPTAPPR